MGCYKVKPCGDLIEGWKFGCGVFDYVLVWISIMMRHDQYQNQSYAVC